MKYNRYGSTGIEVSSIGFGGMRFQDQSDVDGCAALVKTAYDAGINYFDTAPGYGKSEDLFGAAFKEMKKTRSGRPFLVSTKTMKSDPSDIRREFERSLERMNLERIDFYHMWYVLSPDEYRKRASRGALGEFERLRDEGLVRHICISTHMDGEGIETVLNDYPFDGVLLGYSALNCAHRERGIQAAADLGRGVAIMNPLGGGTIPKHPELFEHIKSQANETAVEAALRFLIDDSRISVALVGFSEQSHIREAVSAADGYRPIPTDLQHRIRDFRAENYNSLCTSCRYCDDCPQGINVPAMMESYNSILLENNVGQMLAKLSSYWGENLEESLARQCVECGRCEAACTQKLPIIRRMKNMRPHIERRVAERLAAKP